jgi:hypothetical protein
MDIKQLIYTKDFSQDVKFKLLDIVRREDWVDGLLNLIQELDNIPHEESEEVEE